MKLDVYLEMVKLKLQSMMINRGAFLWHMAAQVTVYTVTIVLLSILLDQFGSVGGWSKPEVILLYAMNLFSHGLSGLFFYLSNMLLGLQVRRGRIDELMTRPVSVFWANVCKNIHYPYAAYLVLSAIVMAIAFAQLGITLSPLNVLFLVVVLIAGAAIQAAFLISISVPAFFMVEPRALNYLMWDVKGFVRYPVSVYFRPIQIILTFVLPFAFIAFYPAEYFLGKRELLFHPVLQFLSPAIGLVLFMGAYRLFRWGLDHYESTGT